MEYVWILTYTPHLGVGHLRSNAAGPSANAAVRYPFQHSVQYMCLQRPVDRVSDAGYTSKQIKH